MLTLVIPWVPLTLPQHKEPSGWLDNVALVKGALTLRPLRQGGREGEEWSWAQLPAGLHTALGKGGDSQHLAQHGGVRPKRSVAPHSALQPTEAQEAPPFGHSRAPSIPAPNISGCPHFSACWAQPVQGLSGTGVTCLQPPGLYPALVAPLAITLLGDLCGTPPPPQSLSAWRLQLSWVSMESGWRQPGIQGFARRHADACGASRAVEELEGREQSLWCEGAPGTRWPLPGDHSTPAPQACASGPETGDSVL